MYNAAGGVFVVKAVMWRALLSCIPYVASYNHAQINFRYSVFVENYCAGLRPSIFRIQRVLCY